MISKKMPGLILGALCLYATMGLAANAPGLGPRTPAEIAKAAALTPPFSEDRTAAAAYVGVLNFVVGRMGITCQTLVGGTDRFPAKLETTWQTKNAVYYRVTSNYFTALLNSVPDPRAAALLQTSIAKQVQDGGQHIVSDLVFGTTADKTNECRKFVVDLVNGKYTINEQTPVFKTLQGMVPEFDRPTAPTPAP